MSTHLDELRALVLPRATSRRARSRWSKMLMRYEEATNRFEFSVDAMPG